MPINKPKIINDGKEWNVEDLKLKLKKVKEMGKTNEGKEFKKNLKYKILKSYVKKVNNKIVEKKIKVNPTIKTEERQENNPKTEIDKIIDEWDKKDLSRVLYYDDSDAYDKIKIIVTREIKRKKFL